MDGNGSAHVTSTPEPPMVNYSAAKDGIAMPLDRRNLENQLQGELHAPRISGGGDLPRARSVDIRPGKPEERRVRGVEGFGPELETEPFGQ